MAGGRDAVCREDGQSGFDLAWGCCTGSEASAKYRISGDRDSGVVAGHPHAPRRATPIGRPNPARWRTAV
jgi:hypothetical protein